MSPTIDVAPARPDELEIVFRLVFQHVTPQERERRVGNALQLVRQGEFDPAGMFLAAAEGRPLGAIVCLPVPGASGLVWPPQAVEGLARQAVEDRLVRHASAWLRGRGARLGQSLLAPHERALAAPLERNGFAHVTSLCYMQFDLDGLLPFDGEERLAYESYRRLRDVGLFHRTLFRTYQGTQDCPEVSGVRTMDEVMEGHRSQGKFDPDRWWLAWSNGEPVGVLLLNEVPEWAAWDVAYVGVVPEARGRGFGRELMLKALWEARLDGVPRLTLSVDVRNRPAWHLYTELGFEPTEQREVFLAIWR